MTIELSPPKPRTLRTLIPKGHRAKWFVVALIGVATALAESAAALLIAALIAAMMETSTELDLPLVGDVAEWVPGESHAEQLRYMAIGIGIFFIAKGIVQVIRTYAQSRVSHNTGARLSNRLFQGYLRMPYSFHLAHNSSELIRNASWAADEVVINYLQPLAAIIVNGALLITLLAVLVASAPTVTMVTLGTLLPITITIMAIVRPKLRRLGDVTNQSVKDSFNVLQQSLHGIRDVKILSRESYFSTEFGHIRSTHSRSRYKSAVLSFLPSAAVETLVIVAIIGFVAIASSDGIGPAALPTLGLFAYAGLRMMPATSKVVSNINKLRYGQAAAETVAEELHAVQRDVPPTQHEAPAIVFNDLIELDHVSFSYTDDNITLDDINLSIKKGESLGIVGETGAGKSTLLDIILGLLPPTSGKVTVDGQDISRNPTSWHSLIGLVPQAIYLLDDTVRHNIAYGLRENEIDDERVNEAVRLAQLEGFLGTLPSGVDSDVGERGIRVSGGQRQRVAIARALYNRPEVLVFDEGTASLDNLTEAQLLRSIEDLHDQDHTIITVAHRLTTVKNCDRVILLEQGKITDEGTYEELRERNVTFRRMSG